MFCRVELVGVAVVVIVVVRLCVIELYVYSFTFCSTFLFYSLVSAPVKNGVWLCYLGVKTL